MRRPIIAGNWKMNKTVAEALALVDDLKREFSGVKEVDLVVCPPFTALESSERPPCPRQSMEKTLMPSAAQWSLEAQSPELML